MQRIHDARAFTRSRRAVHADLLAAARSPAFRAAAARCPEVLVPDFRARPLLLLAARGAHWPIAVGNLPDGRRGLLVTYASDRVRGIFTLGASGEVPLQAAPAGGRLVAANRSWLAYAVC
jgi:hypothetical protein